MQEMTQHVPNFHIIISFSYKSIKMAFCNRIQEMKIHAVIVAPI